MEQCLVAITLRSRNYPELSERVTYRVSLDTFLSQVVAAAKLRCEIIGDLRCTSLEFLDKMPPERFYEFPELLAAGDATDDFTASMDTVVVLRENGVLNYRVSFHGRLCSPAWPQRGPAAIYLAMLRRGQRRPEYA